MSTRYASLGTGLRRSPKTSVVQPWFRRARFTFVNSGTASLSYPATAHTKTAWSQVIASTAENASFLSFNTGNVSASGVDTSTLVDIGVGAAGSEIAIVQDLAVGGWSGAGGARSAHIAFPVAIPSGSRVSIRMQGTRTTGSISNNGIALYATNDYALTPSSVDVLGVTTATSAGTALSGASNTWVEITASTAKDYQCVLIVPSTSSTDTAAISVLYTLGIGASGSEVPIGASRSRYSTSEQWIGEADTNVLGAQYMCGPVPAGSRLSVRHDIASNPGRYNVCLVGVPYV